MKPASSHRGLREPGWTVLADTGCAYTVEMSLRVWDAIPPNPRHRAPARRAAKAHWALAKLATGPIREQLRWVIAADLAGEIFKVDGHVRGLLWASERLPPPERVFATVYRCETLDDVCRLYSVFDTQIAAESKYDQVTGAYREHGIDPVSRRLKGGSIVDALSIAVHGEVRSFSEEASESLDIYAAVAEYATELAALDAIKPGPERFVTGVVAAALITLKEYPEALRFFQDLQDRPLKSTNRKPTEQLDPVDSALEAISNLIATKKARARAMQVDLCARVLSAAYAWVKGPSSGDYWMTGAPRPADIQAAIARAKDTPPGSGEQRSLG